MDILTIIGARPQFIKAAIVSKVLQGSMISERILHTGQHYDSNMSDVFFEQLGINKPFYNLKVQGLSHSEMVGNMVIDINKIIQRERPKHILVYGDTNSTLAGALVAAKENISLIHVEAGLRSNNHQMPEEINRILTDRVSNILFTPTEAAYTNLINEGVNSNKIFNVGDVMYDSVLYYSKNFSDDSFLLNNYNLSKDNFVFATIHRAENTDNHETLIKIFNFLTLVSNSKKVIIPLHPRTKSKLGSDIDKFDNLIFVEPLSYFDTLKLVSNSSFVITDSGGLQKEAYFLMKKVLTLRNETEWQELVNIKWNLLVPPDTINDNLNQYFDFINKHIPYENNLYGDGFASKKIAEIIKTNL